jgi:glycosyltransferase involved in cell wall biosynthesis
VTERRTEVFETGEPNATPRRRPRDRRTMTRPTPSVTIGVPVYNGERYLAACLDSLLAQTFRDFTIIVSDNASTDRTGEIAREYSRRHPEVRYHRNPVNIGCPRNFGKVFELSDTPYFRWASADDLSAPELLERCVEVLDSNPDVVQVYPRTLLIDAHSSVTRRYVDGIHTMDDRPSARYVHVTEKTGLCNAIYGVIRADALRRTALLGSYIGSDVPLQAELALHGKICELPEYLFLRRMHAEAQSAMSDDARAIHYDPAAPARKRPSAWRHFWERWRAVYRAPASLSEKARVARYLVRKSIKGRDGLGRELLIYLGAGS